MKNKAIDIVKKLQDAGYIAVFAGGCVRDAMLSIEPKDYDIATNASPNKIEELFDKTVGVGKSFGVIVVIEGDFEFEVATFRNDGSYSNGRHPDFVELLYDNDSKVVMKADALRRDFSINGMFYDPIKEEIHDYVGGASDLGSKMISFIGDAEDRIKEDKLRMLRAIRFVVRFDGDMLYQDFKDIKKHASSITQVSHERIRDELCKMFRENPQMSLIWLKDAGLLKYVLPEVHAMIGCEQPPEYHPEGDVFEHTCLALDHLPDDASDELIWATLLHDVGKPTTQTFEERIRFDGHDVDSAITTEEILKRFKFPNKFIDHVVPLVKNHMRWMHVKEMKKSKIKRFLAMDNFKDHIELHRVDCLSSHGDLGNIDYVNSLEFKPEEIKPPRLISGRDLLTMGVKQGKVMGVILGEIEEAQLEGKVNTKEEAMELANHLIKFNYQRS